MRVATSHLPNLQPWFSAMIHIALLLNAPSKHHGRLTKQDVAYVATPLWLWSALRLGLGSALSWIAIRKSENGMNFGAMTP